jgi:hypothetical protein
MRILTLTVLTILPALAAGDSHIPAECSLWERWVANNRCRAENFVSEPQLVFPIWRAVSCSRGAWTPGSAVGGWMTIHFRCFNEESGNSYARSLDIEYWASRP